MRQVIDEATWKAVEGAICVGGLGYSEAGRKFGIEPHAIMGKAKRNNWPLPSKIAERAAVLQTRYNRNGNEEVIQTAAKSWAEKGETHRPLAFQSPTAHLPPQPGLEACQSKAGVMRIWPIRSPGNHAASITRTQRSISIWPS